jgi:phosphocarrier protein
MFEATATVYSRYGIHARPAAAICSVAKAFSDTKICLIDLGDDKQEINAKSILEILTMNKKCGDILIVRSYGKDEQRATEEIARVIREFEVQD